MPKVRPLALCIFHRDDHIFVAEGYDKRKKETYYRPLGGRIEFGEYGIQTVEREIYEEIQQKVSDLKYIGTCENIFDLEGTMGHEIVLVFDGKFTEERMNDNTIRVAGEDNGKFLFVAMWKPLSYFQAHYAPLYPVGLLELIESQKF